MRIGLRSFGAGGSLPANDAGKCGDTMPRIKARDSRRKIDPVALRRNGAPWQNDAHADTMTAQSIGGREKPGPCFKGNVPGEKRQ
ncbi:MAG: hypothetical protein J0H62_01525 [Rhizobiales bacterium]|nr:hypothetical protein [Hyphomicrobiales bacterium]